MEGQLEQRRLPELLRELVDRRQDRRLRRTRGASVRRAAPDRRQRRRRRRDYTRPDQPDVRSGSQPAPLGPRRHDRTIDDARQLACGRRVQRLDATGSRSVLLHLSSAADQGRRADAVDGGRLRRRPPRLVGATAARTIHAERSADRNRPWQRSSDHSRRLRPPAIHRTWLLSLDAVVEKGRAGLLVCRGAGTQVERQHGRVRARDGDGGPQHRPHRLVDDRLPGRRRKRPRDGRASGSTRSSAGWERLAPRDWPALRNHHRHSNSRRRQRDPGPRAMPRPASTPSSRPGSAPSCARRGSGRGSRTSFSSRPTGGR